MPSWSIVNVILPDARAIEGRDPARADMVRQIVADGYEAFGTAALPGVGLIISFRKPSKTPDFREAPGQYL